MLDEHQAWEIITCRNHDVVLTKNLGFEGLYSMLGLALDIMKRFRLAEKQLFNTMSKGVPKEQLDEVVEVLQKLHSNLQ